MIPAPRLKHHPDPRTGAIPGRLAQSVITSYSGLNRLPASIRVWESINNAILLLLISVLATLACVTSATATISNSQVTALTSTPILDGVTSPVTFQAFNASLDGETINSVQVTLPVGWTAACNSQDPADSGGNPVTVSCSPAGNVVTYSGAGAIFAGESWGFVVDVTVPGGTAAGFYDIDYALTGDGSGSAPHAVNGTEVGAIEVGTPPPAIVGEAPVETYFIPIPEQSLRDSNLLISTNPNDATMHTVIGITAAVDNTFLYYDHWEDGFETEANAPASTTTLVLGNGIAVDGCAGDYRDPPVASCADGDDLINTGEVLIFENDVPADPRGTGIFFDATDKISVTEPVAVTRAAWPTTTGTVIAGAVEVFSTNEWGLAFETPVGQNSLGSNFEVTQLYIQAQADDTTINVDSDADDIVDLTIVLDEGETYVVDNIQVGASVLANLPVQVDMFTGDAGTTYESRWFSLIPTESWNSAYITPVYSSGATATVMLYNPGPTDPLTITVTTSAGSSTIVVPAGQSIEYVMPNNSGAKFVATSNFFAIGVYDDESTTYDWGYTLNPTAILSSAVKVGWAPGSSDSAQSYSPLWITSDSSGLICVDWEDDGVVDLRLEFTPYQPLKIEDGDFSQTGARIFSATDKTCTDTQGAVIAVAWGQDALNGTPALPALDLGTTVLPTPALTLSKTSELVGDVNGNGLVEPGDIIRYTLTIHNDGSAILSNVVAEDTLPVEVFYLENTTFINGVPILDAGTSPFPLDEDGYALGDLLPGVIALITYDVRVDQTLDSSVLAILNDASISSDSISAVSTDTTPVFHPSLEVVKTSDASTFAVPGTFINYTITLTNTGSTPQTGIEINDSLPVGTQYDLNSTVVSGFDSGSIPITKDNLPASANPLEDGVPENLVETTDGFIIPVGQTMTVTYRVQIDDPLDPALNSIDNVAIVTTNEEADPVTAEVSDLLQPIVSIGDTVWFDADGDGVIDTGESGLGNVAVYLCDTGVSPCNSASAEATAITDTSGGYLFDRVFPGDYYVQVDPATVPAGLASSTGGDASGSISVTGTQSFLDVDFGYTPSDPAGATLGDVLWSDADGDGIQDPGEPGIGGVTIDLIGSSGVVSTATTAADGSYFFFSVAPGDYTVQVTDTGDVLTGYTSTNGDNSAVTAVAGQSNLDIDFGYQNPDTYSITDTVWLDTDSDGFKDGAEGGIDGVTVNLLDAADNVIGSTVTSSDGTFSFTGLPTGDYTVQIADSGGELTGASGTTPAAAAGELGITLTSDGWLGASFGYNRPGTIDGTVFSDLSSDGVLDPGETGLAGISVELWQDANGDGILNQAVDTLVDTTTTGAQGNYLFNGQNAGTYFVSVEDTQAGLTGFSPTTPDEETGAGADGTQIQVTLPTDQDSASSIDFGYAEITSLIPGTVWYDLDGDGAQDPGEIGIPGVEVSLTPPAGVDIGAGAGSPIFTNTDATGSYQFGVTETGDFVIEVDPNGTTLPAGLTQTGCPGASCNGQTTVTVLTVGDVVDTSDFGYQPSGTISGTVYDDEDTSGGQNGTEPGLQGVEVGLYYDDGLTPVLDSSGNPWIVITDIDGDYIFANLPGDDYVFIIDPNETTLPSGYVNYEDPDGPSPNGDVKAAVTLADGGSAEDQNFGYNNDPLRKAVDKSTAMPGETLTYTLIPTYSGSELLSNVQVSDTIPAGTTYVGDSDTPEATISEPAGGGTGPIAWDLGSNAAAVDGNTPSSPGSVGAFGTATQEIDTVRPGDNKDRLPEITTDASGNLHAVFIQDDRRTYYTTSADNGTNWTGAVQLPLFFAEDKDRNADIAVDSNGDIHVVVDNENKNVLYTRSTDGGATWPTVIEIDTSTGDSNDRFPRIVVADNDDLHVVFNNNNERTYYQKSIDGGTTWLGSPVLLPQFNSEDKDRNADLVVTGNNHIHVVVDNENKNIFYARSTDGGSSFINQGEIDSAAGDSDDSLPKIVADNLDSLHVVFNNNNNERTYYQKSTDGGTTWLGSPVALPQFNSEDKDRNADITVDECGVLHVAVDNENKNVFYTNSVDGGANWSAGVEIDTNIGSDAADQFPVIAVTGSTVNVLFDDNSENVFHNSAVLTLCSPATHTELSAGPSLVADGTTIAISMLVSANAAVNDISPSAPSVFNPSGGAACDSITAIDVGPKDIAAGGNATFSWTCLANDGANFGSVSFQGSASGTSDGDGLPVSFPIATSNSVLISPPITFQVLIDLAPGVDQIENTGFLQDDNQITTPVPSNQVITNLRIDYGDAPASFGDASHGISSTLYIGSAASDPESGSQSNADASGDDDDGNDDDDGVTFRSPAGGPRAEVFADVTVANSTGSDAFVCAWLDRWDATGFGSGAFDAGDVQDSPGVSCQTVPTNGGTPTPFTFRWSGMPEVSGFTYLRARTCETVDLCNVPDGLSANGEVEDHRIDFDFTPTAATIGDVQLDTLSVVDFLDSIGVAQMDRESLLELLAKWDPIRAASLSEASQDELLIALLDFLDPDLDGQVAVLRWDTLEERGTIGFYVERQLENGDWVQINNDMLPGLIMAPFGGEYMLADPGAQPGQQYLYQLIEQEANGNTKQYGPFSVQMP